MEKRMLRPLLAGLSLLAVLSCAKESWTGNGPLIPFGAVTWMPNAPEGGSRTVYSGELIGTDTRYERIDWVPGCDAVTVWCAEATTRDGGHAWDYRIGALPETNAAGLRTSVAALEPAGNGDGLQWGDESALHRFFSFYPAPSMTSEYGVPCMGRPTLEPGEGGGVVLSGTIPAGQVYGTFAGGEFKPDMTCACMWAQAAGYPSDTRTVSLQYRPLFTAYEFTLFAGDAEAEDLLLRKATLVSDAGPLSGRFTATLAPGGTPEITALEDTGTEVSIVIGEADRLRLSASDVVKLTFLTLPTDQTCLTLDLLFERGGVEARRRLHLRYDRDGDGTVGADEWVSVPACRKVFIHHVGVPGELLFYDMVPVDDIVVPGLDALSGAACSVVVDTEGDGEDGYQGLDRTKAVGWKAYYLGGDGPIPAKGTVRTGIEGLSETPVQPWLKVLDGSGEGNGNADDFRFRVTALDHETIDWDNSPDARAMRELLQANDLGVTDLPARAVPGSGAGPGLAETANCYIIDGYGEFLIPLVYGNAWKGGARPETYIQPAPAQYAPTRFLFDSAPSLTTLVNADGTGITHPFILEDLDLPLDACDAVLVWQDLREGSEIILDSDVDLIPAPANASVPGCACLRVRVSRDRVKSGNAVVALRDRTKTDSNGQPRILWSWHLWFRTDLQSAPLGTKTVRYPSNLGETASVDFLTENLGWTPPVSYRSETSPEETQRIVFVCRETGRVLSGFKVRREQAVIPGFRAVAYGNTYYNWGRKDPFLPGNGANLNRPWTSEHYRIAPKGESASRLFLHTLDGDSVYDDVELLRVLCGSLIRSPYEPAAKRIDTRTLWNLLRPVVSDGSSGFREEKLYVTAKTVYDPSPAGFAVPPPFSFTGFTDGTGDGNGVTAEHVYGAAGTAGWTFTTDGVPDASTYGIFFPASGWRDSSSSDGALLRGESEYGACWTDSNLGRDLARFAPTRFLVETYSGASLVFNPLKVEPLCSTFMEDVRLAYALISVRPVREQP